MMIIIRNAVESVLNGKAANVVEESCYAEKSCRMSELLEYLQELRAEFLEVNWLGGGDNMEIKYMINTGENFYLIYIGLNPTESDMVETFRIRKNNEVDKFTKRTLAILGIEI